MLSQTLLVALAVVGSAVAQVPVQNYTSSLDMKIDPNEVTDQMRAQWCGAETTSCSELCGNTDTTNECERSTLEYKCICGSNSSAPGLQYYTQTMPTFICQSLYDKCIKDNVGFARNQDACQTNIRALCGTQDPTKASTGSSGGSSSSASASDSTTTNAPEATGSTGSGSATTTSQSGFAAPTMAAGQGIAAAAAAVGVFAYLL